jgi:hypothetical protein
MLLYCVVPILRRSFLLFWDLGTFDTDILVGNIRQLLVCHEAIELCLILRIIVTLQKSLTLFQIFWLF